MKTTSFFSVIVSMLMLALTHTLSAQSNTYHLVVGSYVSFDLADQKLKDLDRSGYDGIVIFPNDKKKRFRVSVYHSKNRTEVVSYDQMLKRQGMKDGWIYTEVPPKPKEVVATTPSTVPSPFRSVPRRDESQVSRSNIDPSITYHLIVGTFNNMTTANDYARQLDTDGFEAVILNPDKVSNKHRVSIYFTHNKAEIEAYASSVRRQGKVKGWVYAEHAEDGTRVVPSAKTVPAIPTRNDMSYLVVASFVSHLDAAEHAAKLSKSGLSPSILLPSAGETSRYRISLYQSSNRADVAAYQRQLKNSGKDTGWILN